MAREVSSFDAKTHLSNLLSQVQKGQEFVITKHKHAVARLIPIKKSAKIRNTKQIINEIQDSSKSYSLNLAQGAPELKSIGRK
ncbi:MAG: hypothetical protein COA94_06515 [Rickettsiales bacterium]|nr:MAG: hypothetical protein COA94_06515 [Rickettsiales bacterium]